MSLKVPALPLVWGARNIAKTVNLPSSRAAFHLLAQGKIPGARLIGGRWAFDPELARKEFADMPSTPVEGSVKRGRPPKMSIVAPPPPPFPVEA